MSVVSRGVKNAFRNKLRTLAAVLILAIGIGLSLSMMVANEAVTAKINELKTQVGTKLTIRPAGSMGREGGGEPLKMADIETVRGVAHVADVSATNAFTLENENAPNVSAGGPLVRLKAPGAGDPGKTNLKAAIEPGTLGKRGKEDVSGEVPVNLMLPIMGTGTQGTDPQGNPYHITEGRNITKDDAGNVAIVGKDLAAKNNLGINSTFTAYGQTFTVVGIYDQGTRFDNGGVAIPLTVAQTLNNTPGEVAAIVATVDSIDNLDSAKAAIVGALGQDRADVVPAEQNAQAAIDSLKGVQQISIVAFVGALVASAVITFLIMVMVVRERRREIGVLKAIGGSNPMIVSQFVAEAMVLVVLGAVIGLGITLVSSGSIANALVSSSADEQTALQPKTIGEGLRPVQIRGGSMMVDAGSSLIGQVATQVGWTTIAYGAIAIIVIAVVGSAIPAWLIAKVRPAEVLRGE